MTRATALAAAAASGFRRNRIHNGAMMIDQRFANVGLSIGNSNVFGDRWVGGKAAAATVVCQLNFASPDPANAPLPSALVYNVTAGAAAAAGDYVGFWQTIEGADMGDLRWGTAAAKPVTLSFAVYTPLAGLYCFRLGNHGSTRCYVGSFTVNAANTWETKQVTIPGDVAGTWGTTTSDKWQLFVDLGSGSTQVTATAGVWVAANVTRIAGSVNFASAVRAFFMTAIQLEVGSVATPFEWRPVHEQLALCRRWFQRGTYRNLMSGSNYTGGTMLHPGMRMNPIIAYTDQVGNVSKFSTSGGNNVAISAGSISNASGDLSVVDVILASAGSWAAFNWTTDCEFA